MKALTEASIRSRLDNDARGLVAPKEKLAKDERDAESESGDETGNPKIHLEIKVQV